MKRRQALVAAAVAAAAVLLFFLRWRHENAVSGPEGRPPAQASGLPGPNSEAAHGASPASPADDAPSHLADQLGAPGGDIHADLRILDEIFRQYRSALHGQNPIGDNADITAALAGKNRLGFAFIPPNHPAIDGRGELCDRWGTPFFFHQLSGTQMEIRSAGPDRKLWTADDEVLTPGLYGPRL
jgi:hypothetical protein